MQSGNPSSEGEKLVCFHPKVSGAYLGHCVEAFVVVTLESNPEPLVVLAALNSELAAQGAVCHLLVKAHSL